MLKKIGFISCLMVSPSKCKKYMDGLKSRPHVGEFFRQVEAGVVSNSWNKIHQTWGPPYNRAM